MSPRSTRNCAANPKPYQTWFAWLRSVQRRRFVTGLAGGLGSSLAAGCVDNGDREGDDDAGPQWREAPDVTDLSVEITGPLFLDASVKNHGTYSRPPVIALELQAGDEPRWFGPFRGVDTPLRGIVLSHVTAGEALRLFEGDVIVPAGECWVAEPAPEAPPADYVFLEPNESNRAELALVPDVDPVTDDEPTMPADRPDCYFDGAYVGEDTVSVLAETFSPDEDDPADHRVAEASLEVRVELG